MPKAETQTTAKYTGPVFTDTDTLWQIHATIRVWIWDNTMTVAYKTFQSEYTPFNEITFKNIKITLGYFHSTYFLIHSQ